MINAKKLVLTLCAAIAGVFVATGFQNGTEKVATCDLSSVVETSDLGKANIAVLEKMKSSREGLLKFIDENRVLTVDQAKNLRTLWIKDPTTPADTATLERLKADVTAQAKKNVELSTKTNLTGEERTLLQEYASRSATMEQVAAQWFEDFRQEIGSEAQARRVDTLNKARVASQTVAKAQGYTLVFDSSVAVYAANDITAETLRTMNLKK